MSVTHYTKNYFFVFYKKDQSSNWLIQNYTLDWRRCRWETSLWET